MNNLDQTIGNTLEIIAFRLHDQEPIIANGVLRRAAPHSCMVRELWFIRKLGFGLSAVVSWACQHVT